MNRKSPSLYIRIKMNYFRLILKGIKILMSRENKYRLLSKNYFDFICKNSNNKSQNFSYNILNNPFQNEFKSQIYNKYKIWLMTISCAYLFFYFRHNYTQPVKNNLISFFYKINNLFRNLK